MKSTRRRPSTSRASALRLIAALVLAGLVAGCAAVLGGQVARREARAEATYPPGGAFVTVAGHRVHYVVRGRGPDLVLIHGASGNLRDFTFDLVGRLAPHYRVIVFDRPGLGYSDSLGDAAIDPGVQARELIAAARLIGVRRPIVFGQSYGGAVALAWALADPDGTAALVLAAAASEPWEGELGPLTRITASPIGGATLVPVVTAFAPEGKVEAIIDSIFAPQHAPPGYARYIGADLTLRRRSLIDNARQVNGLKPYLRAMSHRYGEIRMPVELLHGTADRIVPWQVHSERLAAQIPGAHLELLEGVGHMLHHVDPQATVAAIDRAARRARLD